MLAHTHFISPNMLNYIFHLSYSIISPNWNMCPTLVFYLFSYERPTFWIINRKWWQQKDVMYKPLVPIRSLQLGRTSHAFIIFIKQQYQGKRKRHILTTKSIWLCYFGTLQEMHAFVVTSQRTRQKNNKQMLKLCDPSAT